MLKKDRDVDAWDLWIIGAAIFGGLCVILIVFALIIFGALMLIQNRG